MQDFLFDQLEPRMGDIEEWCIEQKFRYVIGVDEAGRGPLAGPVHAAAVVLDLERLDDEWVRLLDDSKKLTPGERETAYQAICESSVAFAVAYRDQRVIDEINILRASLRAMEEAIDKVCAMLDAVPDRVFVDGNMPCNTTLAQQTVVGGDGRSLHIAAASILAKVERDRVMTKYHERWPEYSFLTNKGYGTTAHREAIAAHGPCDIHRLSFNGVSEHVDTPRSGK